MLLLLMIRSSLLVADYLLILGKGTLTPMQVNKLAFICHGYTLAITSKELVDEPIQAWHYGPVIPSIYHGLKLYKARTIDSLSYCSSELSDTEKIIERKEFIEKAFLEKELMIMQRVFDKYQIFNASQLSSITHKKDSPWDQYHKKGKFDIIIPNEIIKEYYIKLMIDNRKS